MSKLDALRAMREARYAAATSASKPAARRAPAKQPAPAAPRAAGGTAEAVEVDESLCGHRNMSGRTCTRERGHAAKSHRYS